MWAQSINPDRSLDGRQLAYQDTAHLDGLRRTQTEPGSLKSTVTVSQAFSQGLIQWRFRAVVCWELPDQSCEILHWSRALPDQQSQAAALDLASHSARLAARIARIIAP